MLFALAAAVGLLLDGRLLGSHVPTIKRQVNQEWIRRYRGWFYGLAFGFELGTGILTVVTSSAVYLVLVGALLSGSVRAGAAVGAAFGFTRAAQLLLVARVDRPAHLAVIQRRLLRWARPARWGTAAAQAALVLAIGLTILFSN